MKKIGLFVLLCLKTVSGFPLEGIAAASQNNSLNIITVKAEKAYMYSSPRYTSKKIAVLKKGEEFPVMLSTKYYYKIVLLDGKTGYISKSKVNFKQVNRVVMGWNYAGNTDAYIQQNSISPNLNVVSPRWFSLNGTEPYISVNAIDSRYLEAAHNSGKQIWPLFGNKFDTQLTDSILSDPVKREKAVATVKDVLVQNRVEGINVDFENMDIKNKGDYVSFIRELKNALLPYGIVVSVDVTRENPDPFWSGSLDRMELGKAADFIIMMGYDEHWSGGNKAGSVASIPWVRDGIRSLMKEVPSHKIILGVPFYTREWVTDIGTGSITSYDRSMGEVQQIISDRNLTVSWDNNFYQNYVEFTENGKKHQIWIENAKSMEYRRNLINEYKLRGVAAWYIGSETSDIWTLFDAYKI